MSREAPARDSDGNPTRWRYTPYRQRNPLMFGMDEFGNTRLLAIAFAILLATLSLGAIATSQTLW